MKWSEIDWGEPQIVVYALHDGDGEIRYVGKTAAGMSRRLYDHYYRARTKPTAAVHKWIKARGDAVMGVVLEECSSDEEARVREVSWIEKLRADGARLLNHTGGGEGVSGSLQTPEHLAKLSAARKGLLAGEKHFMYGKHHTPEALKKISDAALARWADPEFRKRALEARNPLAGEKHPMVKISKEQAQYVLDHPEETGVSLAEKFGLTTSGISRIRRRKTWRHLTPRGEHLGA